MNLQAWWASLDVLMRVLYAIAVPASVVLLIEAILAVIGFGHGAGIDAGSADAPADLGLHHADAQMDFHHGAVDFDASSQHDFAPGGHDASDATGHGSGIDALRLFTLTGVMSFFTAFAWSSIILLGSGLSGALAVVIGLIPGAAAMYLAAKIVQLSSRLSESGTLDLDNTVGLIATVYIPIPGGGEGKVMITVQGHYMELSAVSDGEEAIPSGTEVRVAGVRGDVLIVEPLATGKR